MQSSDTQIKSSEPSEHTTESLIDRFKEFQSYIDFKAPDCHYKIKEFLFYNIQEELIAGELFGEQHLLWLSERIDEEDFNYSQFVCDSLEYGVKRTKRMWTVLESMNLNDEQYDFAVGLYRFALDLSLDVTVEEAISFRDNAIQIRFHNGSLDETDDHTVINNDGLGFRLYSNQKSIRRLVNHMSAVLDLGESWSDELVRLAKIIVKNYSWEYVSSIALGSGRIVVEFA